LVYNIYTDPGHTSVWGDGSGGSNELNGSVGLGHGLGNNGTNTVNYTSYGRITAGQDVLPGTYMDLLTVTVTY
jgi:spore coat protein U-like protein